MLTRWRSPWVPGRLRWAATVLATALLGACALAPAPQAAQPPAPGQVTGASEAPVPSPEFGLYPLPGATPDRPVRALVRPARVGPPRLRVIAVPGSGCTGFAPFADRYFAGLLHAEVWVLHKPGVDLQAGAAPTACPPGFVEGDALGRWQADALAALRAMPAVPITAWTDANAPLPTVLVGISEGAELLPVLATAVPGLRGLVLLGAPGLDPLETAGLQVRRLGVETDWARVRIAAASSRPDSEVVEGRALAYWRDFLSWPLAQPLIDSPWPLLQVFGTADTLVPPQAYARFAARARGRSAPFCAWPFPDADHGLQGPEGRDGLQILWAWLERWVRQPRETGLLLCDPQAQERIPSRPWPAKGKPEK